jgi:hypothetical protein
MAVLLMYCSRILNYATSIDSRTKVTSVFFRIQLDYNSVYNSDLDLDTDSESIIRML